MLAEFKPLTRDCKLPALVFVGADWCGHCQHAAPEIKKASKILARRNVATYAIDGETREPLVNRLGVQGFPTILAVARDRRIHEYEGPRDARSIAKFCLEVART